MAAAAAFPEHMDQHTQTIAFNLIILPEVLNGTREAFKRLAQMSSVCRTWNILARDEAFFPTLEIFDKAEWTSASDVNVAETPDFAPDVTYGPKLCKMAYLTHTLGMLRLLIPAGISVSNTRIRDHNIKFRGLESHSDQTQNPRWVLLANGVVMTQVSLQAAEGELERHQMEATEVLTSVLLHQTAHLRRDGDRMIREMRVEGGGAVAPGWKHLISHDRVPGRGEFRFDLVVSGGDERPLACEISKVKAFACEGTCPRQDSYGAQVEL